MKGVLFALAFAISAWGQRGVGELRIHVADPTGTAIEAQGGLAGQASGVMRKFDVPALSGAVLRALPFGRYRLLIERTGFASHSKLIEVSSEIPAEVNVTLSVAPLQTELVVRDSDTLLSAGESVGVQHIGQEAIAGRRSATPGRGVLELVNTQPGWLLEANGVLHPRGSEYQVQYVVDGLPLLDNRSPAFAQSLDVEEFAALDVRTAGYPAEYGRKLGGVIELRTERDLAPGLRTKAVVQGGSFGTLAGYLAETLSGARGIVGFSAEGSFTDRFLDPPVRENFNNHASTNGFSVQGERIWSDHDRTRAYVQRRISRFQVPNELLQNAAGQRQDRNAVETAGRLSHTHLFSPRVLADLRFQARDTASALWSNTLSTPIASWQNRSFREAYGSASLSANFGAHEWKAGADLIAGTVRESFRYRIVTYRVNPGNVRIFDRDLPATFEFVESQRDREASGFLQDRWRWKGLTLSAGLRFDNYRLVGNKSAWSPRLSASYYLSAWKLSVHASYDRTFETPAVENVLLSSTNRLRQLGNSGAFLPLRPARGHYVEAGFSKALASHLRVDSSWYRRKIRDFQDDSLLLNTGVSFPIAFSEGEIHGFEVKAEVPRWGAFSGFLTYSNLVGRGYGPVSGGLFLGDDADQLTSGSGSFAITQDQRNTVQARVRVQLVKRLWAAAGGHYYSGLPVEIDGPTLPSFLRSQYGSEILDRVNFSRGRVRPTGGLDLSAGVDIWQRERRALRLTGDLLNATNRLNVINFAGVFSGTAIAPGRTGFLRLQVDF